MIQRRSVDPVDGEASATGAMTFVSRVDPDIDGSFWIGHEAL
jgi:hypothetical protein